MEDRRRRRENPVMFRFLSTHYFAATLGTKNTKKKGHVRTCAHTSAHTRFTTFIKSTHRTGNNNNDTI